MRWLSHNVKDLFAPGATISKDTKPLSEAEVAAKVQWLASEWGRLRPSLLLLQEIASEDVLRSVLERAGMGGFQVLFGTPDDRGIRNALVTELPIVSHRDLLFPNPGFVRFRDDTSAPYAESLVQKRSFVQAVVDCPWGQVLVVSFHLKSNRPVALRLSQGGERSPQSMAEHAEGAIRSAILRTTEALALRRYLDEQFRSRPDLSVFVGGDLNDAPQSLPFRTLAGTDPALPRVSRGMGALFPVLQRVEVSKRFSVLHRGVPELIDHLFLSADVESRVTSLGIENHALRNHDQLGEGYLFDSDHAAVWVELPS